MKNISLLFLLGFAWTAQARSPGGIFVEGTKGSKYLPPSQAIRLEALDEISSQYECYQTKGTQTLQMVALSGTKTEEKIPGSVSAQELMDSVTLKEDPLSLFSFWSWVSAGALRIKANWLAPYTPEHPMMFEDTSKFFYDDTDQSLEEIAKSALSVLETKAALIPGSRFLFWVPWNWIQPQDGGFIFGMASLNCLEIKNSSYDRKFSILYMPYPRSHDAQKMSEAIGTNLHEFGHNLGLDHANRVKGIPHPSAKPKSQEYKDPVSVMGYRNGIPALEHLLRMNYISPEQVLHPQEEGLVYLSPLEHTFSKGKKGIKIPQSGTKDGAFWLECRNGYEPNKSQPKSRAGLYVHYSSSEIKGFEAEKTHWVTRLREQESWSDPVTGQSFELNRILNGHCEVNLKILK